MEYYNKIDCIILLCIVILATYFQKVKWDSGYEQIQLYPPSTVVLDHLFPHSIVRTPTHRSQMTTMPTSSTPIAASKWSLKFRMIPQSNVRSKLQFFSKVRRRSNSCEQVIITMPQQPPHHILHLPYICQQQPPHIQ